MFAIHNFANINGSFFQSNHNSPLPLETADDLFDDVSFPFYDQLIIFPLFNKFKYFSVSLLIFSGWEK